MQLCGEATMVEDVGIENLHSAMNPTMCVLYMEL